jgi:hypothetical protein
MSQSQRQARGSTSAQDDDPRRRKGFPWWLLGLAALAVLAVLLLSRCGNDDDGTQNNAAPGDKSSISASASSSSSASDSSDDDAASDDDSGSDVAGQAGGSLTAGSAAILPSTGKRAAGNLTQYDGQNAVAKGVRVQSVPADEGFWVGTNNTDRVWVQLVGKAGESPYQVKQGDAVNFEGKVASHGGGFADQVGVSEADGAQQLTTQKAHVEVAKGSVKLSRD